VHRDFKPSNVLVGNDGRVRVMDFGLARAAGDAAPARAEIASSSDALDSDLTATGALLGTPLYMPPEAFRGEIAGEAGDQFSFCVALYQALYGKSPFPSSVSPEHDAHWIANDPRGGAPRWLWLVIARGLAREPSARYPSMASLITALGRDPRRRRLQVAAIGVLALAGGAAVAGHRLQHAHVIAACEREGDVIAETWSEARGSAIGKAFAATGLAHAPSMWSHARDHVAAFATKWRQARTSVCEDDVAGGARLGPATSAAASCLDEQRDDLDALLSELAHPDHGIVDNVGTATMELPRVETCVDPVRLVHETAPPFMLKPLIRVLHRQLARARAEGAVRQTNATLTHLQVVLDQARASGWPPLAIASQLALGSVQLERGHGDDAVGTDEQAYFAAGANARDEQALHAAYALLKAHNAGNHYEQAKHWGRVAEMLVARLGDRDDRLALGLAVELTKAHAKDKDPEGIRKYVARQQAVSKRFLDQDDVTVMYALQQLGYTHRVQAAYASDMQAEYAAAEDAYEKAVRFCVKDFGEEDNCYPTLVERLGTVQWDRGEFAVARTSLERVVAWLEQREGAEGDAREDATGLLGNALINLGGLYDEMGESELSLKIELRALAIKERAREREREQNPGSSNGLYDISVILFNLSELYEKLDRGDDAISAAQRAVALIGQFYGEDDKTYSRRLAGLARLYAHFSVLAKARTAAARALQIAEKLNSPNATASALDAQCDVSIRQAEFTDAIAQCQRSLAIRIDEKQRSDQLAATRFLLAQALWGAGPERSQARALASAAREGYVSLHGRSNYELAEVDRWLASHP